MLDMPKSLRQQIDEAANKDGLTNTEIAKRMTDRGYQVTGAIVGRWRKKNGEAKKMKRENLEALIVVLGLNRTEAWIAALDLDVDPPPVSDAASQIALDFDTLDDFSKASIRTVVNGLMVLNEPSYKQTMKAIEAKQRNSRK